MPAGVTYVSHVASLGTYDSGSGFWGMAALDVGATVTLDITAQVDVGTGGQTITNVATFVGAESTDPFGSNDTDAATLSVNQPQQPILSFGTAGNTQLRTAFHSGSVTTPVIVEPSTNLLTGQSGSPTVLTTGPLSTTLGGTVDVEASGEFLYTPPVGTTGTTDDFQVTLDNSAIVQADIQISDLVWYVDNTAGAGTGLSNAPFNTLFDAEAAHGMDDYIYVDAGDLTTTGYDTGIFLQNGARLIGEGVALDISPFGLFVPAGSFPTLTNPFGSGINLASNSTVRGLDISNTSGGGIIGNAIINATVSDVTITNTDDGLGFGGASGTIDVNDVTITNARAVGLDISGGSADIQIVNTNITSDPSGTRPLQITSTNGGSVTFSSGSIVANGSSGILLTNQTVGPVDIQAPISGSGVFGGIFSSFNSGTTTLNSINISTTGTGALYLQGNTGSFTVNGGTITSGTGQALFMDSNSSLDVTLADITTTAGGFSNNPAIELTNNSGATNLSGIDVTRMLDGDPAILIDNAGTVVVSGAGNQITSFAGLGAGGSGIDIQNTSGQFTFQSIDVDDGPSGVSLNNFQGDFTVNGGLVNQTTSAGISVLGGSGNYNFGFDVTNTAGRSVNLTSNSGGTYAFSGSIADSGDGILIQNNTGGVFTFSGDLTLTPQDGQSALVATAPSPGGGTLRVTGSTNTVNTTNAIDITNVSVNGKGVTFRSVNIDGSPGNGINLADAGSGPFEITGSGTPLSGGVISNSGGRGINVFRTSNLSFSDLEVSNSALHGIQVDGWVNGSSGLTLDGVLLDNNGSGGSWNGLNTSQVTGNLTVSNTTVRNSGGQNVRIAQTVGTSNILIENSTFAASDSDSGILASATGVSAVANYTLRGNSFTSNPGLGLQVAAEGSATVSVQVDGTSTPNSFTGNGTTGLRLIAQEDAELGFDVSDNLFDATGEGLVVLGVTTTTVNGQIAGTISGNTFTNGGFNRGIELAIDGAAPNLILVSNNDISGHTDNAIQGFFSFNAASTNASYLIVTGNAIALPLTASGDGIHVGVDNAASLCLSVDAGGNSITNAGSGFDIFGGAFGLSTSFTAEGLAAATTDPADVEALFSGQNGDAFVFWTLSNQTGAQPGSCGP